MTNSHFAVFPLGVNSKKPLPGSNGLLDASKGMSIEPGYNVGVATGEASDIVVIDIDPRHDGWAGFAQLQQDIGPLPSTYTVITPSEGRHLYFRYPKGKEVRNKQGIYPGVDIRGQGGYVVAPPSVIDGRQYIVKNASLPIADMPAELVELLTQKPVHTNQNLVQAELAPGQRGDLNKRTLRFLVNGAQPGCWHAEFYQAAMNLKQNGYTHDEASQKLKAVTGVLDVSHDIPCLRDVYENREPQLPPDLPYVAEVAPDIGVHTPLFISAVDLADEMATYLSDKSIVRGEPTGLPGLDNLLGGGKRLGEMTAWHAEAKTGKNTLWHKLMHLWLSGTEKKAMGYASRELTPASEVLPNILSIEHKSNAWTGKPRGDYRTTLASWPLYFAPGYGLFDLDDIRRWMDALQEKGVKYFWFDHLHYMISDPEEHREASKLIKELKTEAKSRNVHIDIIIQPNKLMDGQRLSLNSIKGGAAMGQAIDNLFILERVKDPGVRNVVKVKLEVARSKLAKPGAIYLQYDPVTTDFQEVEEQPWSPPGLVNGPQEFSQLGNVPGREFQHRS